MTLTQLNYLLALLFFAGLSILFSLLKGSTTLSLHALFDTSNTLAQHIFFNIRLPRTCCAFVTGGLLGLAGALMQILLRNPLSDPYVLGTSGGAAIVTLLLLFFGITGVELTLGAWLGSLLSILLIFALTQSKSRWNSEHLILVGIALSSGFSAIISIFILISPDHILRGMMFWLAGDLSQSHISFLNIGILIIGLLCSMLIGRELNILMRGENEAMALGINVHKLKVILFLLSSALTAAAVTLAGCIGFVGLIVPHLFRLLWGYDHRLLLPGCVLLGGTTLTVADTLSRTLFAPQQLPVGIVMTAIGIPIFLLLLQKK